jgi:peptide-methionine (R)-S-oxide reductase
MTDNALVFGSTIMKKLYHMNSLVLLLLIWISCDTVTPLESSSPSCRRRWLQQMTATTTTAATVVASLPQKASAASTTKSRTDGYAVQYTEREWAYLLSGAQYNILRQGGTERQRSSILYPFTATDHVGTYHCAGCNTPLFTSASKFDSGTGWPSFSSALAAGVELEQLNILQATLGGREVRCGTCGGHLGDLFNDGWIYTGTSAAQTGNRYCIDGAALIFQPQDYVEGSGGDGKTDLVFGDRPPPNKVIEYQPSLYRN